MMMGFSKLLIEARITLSPLPTIGHLKWLPFSLLSAFSSVSARKISLGCKSTLALELSILGFLVAAEGKAVRWD